MNNQKSLKEVYAEEVASILHKNGFIAYFAGGWVRDHLLGTPSQDIDIATDALPSEVQQLFKDHISIGAHFGVILVLYKSAHFEITTFRQDMEYLNGRAPEGVILRSSPEEDASRRDFTINGMFYDPFRKTILDYVGGRKDLEEKIIRSIGNPLLRFKEDRLRMLRAVRFAHRFGCTLEENTKKAIKKYAKTLLPSVSIERVVQELEKMRLFGSFQKALLDLSSLNLLEAIFPPLKNYKKETIHKKIEKSALFPKEAPLILILSSLFGKKERAFQENLADYLKMSKKAHHFLKLSLSLQDFLEKEDPEKPLKLQQWVHILACEEKRLTLTSLLVGSKKKALWQKKLLEIEKKYAPFIEMVRSKKRIIHAEDLLALGIHPGKLFGILLEEAERIAIEKELFDKEKILSLLKNHPLYKKQ